jgi:hypothetical protein
LARKINAHNSKILNKNAEKENEMANKIECTCRKKDECPVENKCLQDGVVYQATIKRGDNKVYIGLSATPFKDM